MMKNIKALTIDDVKRFAAAAEAEAWAQAIRMRMVMPLVSMLSG